MAELQVGDLRAQLDTFVLRTEAETKPGKETGNMQEKPKFGIPRPSATPPKTAQNPVEGNSSPQAGADQPVNPSPSSAPAGFHGDVSASNPETIPAAPSAGESPSRTSSYRPYSGAESSRKLLEAPPRNRPGYGRDSYGTIGHEQNRLIVGRSIELKGEIKNCEVLIVEGTVDATLIETRALEISQTGMFKGNAPVETAEIAGTVDGELMVAGLLFLRATGRIMGKVRYGEIEIERGGQMRGDISSHHDDESGYIPQNPNLSE